MPQHKGSMTDSERQIRRYYERLRSLWGEQNWWPAATQWEMILGAFLTQNTAWSNVERALANIRLANSLKLEGCRSIAEEDLAVLIRPAGYFRQKSHRIKEFLAFLQREHNSSLANLFALPTLELRAKLLQQKGIGPETADSILLYGGQREIFVVDTYTRRVFSRHGLCRAEEEYDTIRRMVEAALAPEVKTPHAVRHAATTEAPPVHNPSGMSKAKRSSKSQRFNDFHALLVQIGKHYCRKSKPLCAECPLQCYLPKAGGGVAAPAHVIDS